MSITQLGLHFDTLRSQPMTPAAEAFTKAKQAFKAVVIHGHSLAKEYVSAGSEKAQKKIAEWLNKAPNADDVVARAEFEAAAAHFEKTYTESCQDPQVQAVRAAKKEFKREVMRLLSSGTQKEQIKQDLVEAGVSEKTAQKVNYWARKVALSQ